MRLILLLWNQHLLMDKIQKQSKQNTKSTYFDETIQWYCLALQTQSHLENILLHKRSMVERYLNCDEDKINNIFTHIKVLVVPCSPLIFWIILF